MSCDNLSLMLTKIRNASLARHTYVTLDANKASYALASILKQNGYILGFKVGLKPGQKPPADLDVEKASGEAFSTSKSDSELESVVSAPAKAGLEKAPKELSNQQKTVQDRFLTDKKITEGGFQPAKAGERRRDKRARSTFKGAFPAQKSNEKANTEVGKRMFVASRISQDNATPSQNRILAHRGQKQRVALWKIEKKLRSLMLQRRKLKTKLKLHLIRVSKTSKKTRMFLRRWGLRSKGGQRRRKVNLFPKVPRGEKGGLGTPSTKKRTGLRGKTKPNVSKSQSRSKSRPEPTHRGRKKHQRNMMRFKPGERRLGRLDPPTRSKANIGRKRSTHGTFTFRGFSKLQMDFKRAYRLTRPRLRRAYAYAQGLRTNRGLCFHLQKKRQRLKQRLNVLAQQNTTLVQKTSKQIHIGLKYFGPYRRPAITQIKRISRPSLRLYTNFRRIGRVHDGLGMTVLSTSQGLMSHLQAQRKKLGGEIVATIW